MSLQAKGWILMAVHLLLVGSIAGKYAWERHTCPRVWTRATQYDPEQPLRGRYLALTLHADACALHGGREGDFFPYNPATGAREGIPSHTWSVRVVAENGRLAGVAVKDGAPEAEQLTLPPYLPCGYAQLSEPVEFFVAEHAATNLTLAKGQELWAEVTVPPSGPPRPIHLAVSDGKSFHVLDLR